MPKFAPKIVIVTAALKGEDGLWGGGTALLVPLIDEIIGAEYWTADDIDPVRGMEPQENTPDLREFIPPRRPLGILMKIDESEIQILWMLAVCPTLVLEEVVSPRDLPRANTAELPENEETKGVLSGLKEMTTTKSKE
jgi:hypothetical protein